MSYVFGAAAGDRATTLGSSTIDGLLAYTWVTWIYPTTLTQFRRLLAKNDSIRYIRLNPADEIEVAQFCDSGHANTVTNNVNLTTNKWWFLAVSWYDKSASRVYFADEITEVQEATYATFTANTGTPLSDAGVTLQLFNRETANSGFQGWSYFSGLWNRVLTIQEIRQQRRQLTKTKGCVQFVYLGSGGTGVCYDLSGNGNRAAGTANTSVTHAAPRIIPPSQPLITYKPKTAGVFWRNVA